MSKVKKNIISYLDGEEFHTPNALSLYIFIYAAKDQIRYIFVIHLLDSRHLNPLR
jgi:hypothetical protein